MADCPVFTVVATEYFRGIADEITVMFDAISVVHVFAVMIEKWRKTTYGSQHIARNHPESGIDERQRDESGLSVCFLPDFQFLLFHLFQIAEIGVTGKALFQLLSRTGQMYGRENAVAGMAPT